LFSAYDVVGLPEVHSRVHVPDRVPSIIQKFPVFAAIAPLIRSKIIIMSEKLQRYVHEALLFFPQGTQMTESGEYFVHIDKTAEILSYLGLKLTAKELGAFKQKLLDIHSNGEIPIETFETYCLNSLTGYSEDALLQSFKTLGGAKTGKIPKDELRYFLSEFGQPMDGSDISTLLELAPVD
jgi:hypothetical protein